MDKGIQYRHEMKYRINSGSYHILRQRMKAAMLPDGHAADGVYRITSLYFDDVYRSGYYDKINGVLNRKKYRIRVYNLDKTYIRLEEKRKDDNVGYKKSAVITYGEYERILSGERAFLGEERFSGTAAEDFFVSDSAARLTPSVIVDYLREPYICRAGNVRVTFDMKVSAGINGLDMFDERVRYSPVFPDNDIVLEVKYDNFIPPYIEELLSGVPMTQESVSKYVLCRDKFNAIRRGI